MNIINLVPHEIVLQDEEGTRYVYPPEPIPARVSEDLERDKVYEEGIPVPILSPVKYTAVVGLPDPQEGTIYIVSTIVAGQCPRRDVFSPATGPHDGAIREGGNIIAVTHLRASI